MTDCVSFPNPAKLFVLTPQRPAKFIRLPCQTEIELCCTARERRRRPDVKLTTDEHGADGEDLLSVGVGTDITEAHTG